MLTPPEFCTTTAYLRGKTNLSQDFAFGIKIIMIYHSVNLQEREFSSAFCWSCPTQYHRRLEGTAGVGHCSLETSVEKYQCFILHQLVLLCHHIIAGVNKPCKLNRHNYIHVGFVYSMWADPKIQLGVP